MTRCVTCLGTFDQAEVMARDNLPYTTEFCTERCHQAYEAAVEAGIPFGATTIEEEE